MQVVCAIVGFSLLTVYHLTLLRSFTFLCFPCFRNEVFDNQILLQSISVISNKFSGPVYNPMPIMHFYLGCKQPFFASKYQMYPLLWQILRKNAVDILKLNLIGNISIESSLVRHKLSAFVTPSQ